MSQNVVSLIAAQGVTCTTTRRIRPSVCAAQTLPDRLQMLPDRLQIASRPGIAKRRP